jgi:ABC-2 type transport system permease protein
VYRAEAVKLSAQRRVRAVAVVCLLGPFAFVAGLRLQTTVPADTLFGRWVLTSGFATPLLVLGFATSWALPALVSLVAGDVFSSEDHHGTWKTVLTRSVSRTAVFTGKVLAAATCSVGAVAALALSSTAAGLLLVGAQPLTGLSGVLITPGRALPLVLLAWACVVPPVLAFTALAVLASVASRSSVVGTGAPVLLGLGMQVVSLVGGADGLRHALLSDASTTWHGLLTAPQFLGPLVRGTLVSACWVLACLVVSHELLARRDVVDG